MITIQSKVRCRVSCNSFMSDISEMLASCKGKILTAYESVLGYDVEKKHGKIEEWWGFGSEMTFEMPCTSFFGYEANEMILLIMKGI